jgi:hypothetical protein
LDNLCGVNQDQLLLRRPLQVRGQAPGALSAENAFGLRVGSIELLGGFVVVASALMQPRHEGAGEGVR